MTMCYNRPSITIAVTYTGEVIIAQRKAEHAALCTRYDVSHMETGVYYSQVRHRCAAYVGDGEYRIMTPTQARAHGYDYRPLGWWNVWSV